MGRVVSDRDDMKSGPNEARAHHFVPQCWLAGFTDTGETDGMLWVTDLKRKKQWRCKPSEAGHRRDFYRIDDPAHSDPLAIEKIFSRVESDVVPVFRILTHEKRGPKDGIELGTLLEYMAIQWIRVPTFRAIIGRTVYSHFSDDVLSSRESWERALRKAGVPADNPDADYSQAVAALASGEISFSARPEFYIKHGAELLEEIDACLKKMQWNWLVSESGQFIGFDSPVALDGEAGQPVGFKNAGVVIYPVNRHLLLFGTQDAVTVPPITTKMIAHHNTFAMISADEQVYSHRPDFHWLDKTIKCQNDWRLFSRDDFFQSKII
jgi:hypothetical protein